MRTRRLVLRKAGFAPLRRCAENGFTPRRRSAEHGFTLVELMIVLTIIGIASAAAVLAIPDGHGRLTNEAIEFANRVRAAHDAAIVAGRPVSVWVEPGGYGFDERTGGRWAAMSDTALRVARWQEGTRAAIAAQAGRERLVFDETGLSDRPLDVALSRGRDLVHVRVAADGGVRIDG